MPRSDDKNDRKRGSSRAKPAGTAKNGTGAKGGRSTTPPSAPKKKAALPARPRKSVKAPAPVAPASRARRTAPVDKPGAKKATKPAVPRRGVAAGKRVSAPLDASRPPALDEEERIGDAKYQPRDLPPRLFEEERFIFPESYGQSRIRLLVKDPDWLFAHWDVDPQSLADLRAEMGERASALSKLTLRVSDPQHGGESRVLLPEGARSWYVRADSTERSYRAELGLTLPSGEFRSLAESNTVRTPRTGPAPGGSPRRARYDGVAPPPSTSAAGATRPSKSAAPDPGPWRPDPSTTAYPGPGGASPGRPADPKEPGRPGEPSGGASDVYRR